MLWNAVLVALKEIRRNVLRSFLTVLGIVIGVAAVITMVTLGRGATEQVTAQIGSLGSNLLMITPGQRLGPGQRSTAPLFVLADAAAIHQQIAGIEGVSPQASQRITAVAGNENWSTTVLGVTEDFLRVRDWGVARGRDFLDGERRGGRAVCIIGESVRREIFGRSDPLGARLRLGKLSCEIVGLLHAKGQSVMGTDQDNLVLLPLRTFQRRIAGNQDIPMIQVSVREGVDTARAKRSIEYLLRERRRIAGSEDDDFNVMDMKQIADMLSGTTQVLTMLLGAVAAVSLLVGGIGIMNIMLVSVTERTREIGIRLAIGALEREVLTQFLIEAVVLSSFGGLFGVILALAVSYVLSGVMQVPFVVAPGIIVVAFAFSAVVGVVFGFFPARRAARLDPIDALRHE